MARFGYGKPEGNWSGLGHCWWCGEPLPAEEPGGDHLGYRDNGKFCTLRCGYQWAVRYGREPVPHFTRSGTPEGSS